MSLMGWTGNQTREQTEFPCVISCSKVYYHRSTIQQISSGTSVQLSLMIYLVTYFFL